MIEPDIKEKILDAIEYEQPIMLFLKTSIESTKRLEIIKLIMTSTLPTRVVNFKINKTIDKEFIKEIEELNNQLNRGIKNQWVIVFKDKETMEQSLKELNLEEIIDECIQVNVI